MGNPRLTPEQQDVNLIGVELLINGRVWVVTDSGVRGIWGVTCVHSRSFTSMTTEEINQYKKAAYDSD